MVIIVYTPLSVKQREPRPCMDRPICSVACERRAAWPMSQVVYLLLGGSAQPHAGQAQLPPFFSTVAHFTVSYIAFVVVVVVVGSGGGRQLSLGGSTMGLAFLYTTPIVRTCRAARAHLVRMSRLRYAMQLVWAVIRLTLLAASRLGTQVRNAHHVIGLWRANERGSVCHRYSTGRWQ
ncbi:uncharacterized protein C8Q71DRAFT_255269 [Rhodofomes roseus]|uniref:Uncharacterized protein n=1 Tax=Rhodofomes roseus TaxID=34475 RepID=A0ABQ8K5Z1_9APHY|nr:uncharacterized protein C8Q71DRAFT_255269 [Rhodofomes roseus]KAH9832496.1 hypothetical protein C8Q71DRAFT_255269 [Rhodofomes roseus]